MAPAKDRKISLIEDRVAELVIVPAIDFAVCLASDPVLAMLPLKARDTVRRLDNTPDEVINPLYPLATCLASVPLLEIAPEKLLSSALIFANVEELLILPT
jgi:hypothetical protein